MGGIEMLRQRGNFKLAFLCMMGFFCRIAYEQVFNVTELQEDGTTRVLNSLTESEKLGCSTYCTECGGTACSNLQVTFPNDAKAYKPKGMYEVVRWLHFDDQYVYDNINGKPKTPVTGHWKEEISAVSQVAVEYITASTRQDWELHKLSNGYVKTDSVHGTQYLVDLELKTRSASATSEVRSFRVHLNHPFANVEFLLVLSGNEDGYLETRKRIETTSIGLKSDKIRITTHQGSPSYLGEMHHIINEAVPSNNILFIMNEDMVLTDAAIKHCRSIPIEGKQVYYPVAFGQYDPDIIEKGMPPGKPKDVNKLDHTKFTGSWLYDQTNALCAYRNDFTRVLTTLFSTDSTLEGVLPMTYNAFLQANIRVVNAVEPGLC